MTPKEIIEKRLKDTASNNLTERTFFENKFREYKEDLEQSGKLSASSITTLLTHVASFFSRNSLPLNLKRGDWKSTLETKVKHRFKLSLDDVKAMYAHANLRDRALMLVLAQSGLSEVDTIALKIEDITTLYTMPQTEHYFIEKQREKSNVMQATCISYEALHDIRAMLAERNNPESGFLFICETWNKGEQITTRTVHEAMKNLAEKTFGAEKAKGFKTKVFRSFYNSALLRANLTQEIKDLLMGHERKGARSHYDYDSFTVKEAYKEAFPNLSINGIQSRNDIAEMKNSFTVTLNQITKTLSEVNERNAKLEAKLESLGVDLNTLSKTVNYQQKNIDRLMIKTKTKESVDWH
jgi:integrase